MPEAPKPEMTRPRMTCHMVWPMPLCSGLVCYSPAFCPATGETYTMALLESVSLNPTMFESGVQSWRSRLTIQQQR